MLVDRLSGASALPRPAESGRRRLSIPVLVGASAVAYLVVQALHLRPPMTEDSMTYLEAAQAFPDVATDHWSLRLGLILPLRVLLELFGPSELAYYAIPVVAGVVLVGSTMVIGSKLFGRSVGIASVLVLLSSNWFLSYSSALLPDHVAAALVAAAAAMLLSTGPTSTRVRVAMITVGLLLGWAYLVREFTPLLFIPAGWYVWSRFGADALRWASISAMSVFVFELAVHAIVHGNPLARLFVAGGHDAIVDQVEDPGTRVEALLRFPDALFGGPGTFGVGLLFVASFFSWAVLRRNRWFLVGWIGAYLVPLTLASGALSPDLKLFRAQLLRYWTPVLPAIVVGGLGVLAVLLRRSLAATGLSRSTAWRVAAASVIVTSLVFGSRAERGVAAADIYEQNGATQLDELRTWLQADGADVDVLWTDSQTARAMPLVVRSATGELLWDGEVRAFNSAEDPLTFAPPTSFEPGQAIVFYPFGYLGRIESWSEIPVHIRQLQPGWETELRRDDDTLLIYRVG